MELLKVDSSGSPVSDTTLQSAVHSLNSRIRNRGLSAKEIVTCRDQLTGTRLNVDDLELSKKQSLLRDKNHPYSAKSKAPRAPPAPTDPTITPGSLVYVKSDGNKFTPRELYVVVSIDANNALIQKLRGSTFQARKFTVPLNRLYAMGPNQISLPQAPEETDEDSDDDDIPILPTPAEESEDAASDEDALALATPEPATIGDQTPRRSGRQRYAVDRYGDWVSDDEDEDEEDEDVGE